MNLRRVAISIWMIGATASTAAVGIRSAAGSEGSAPPVLPGVSTPTVPASSQADGQDDPDALARRVYALFEARCLECHGALPDIASGFDLRTDEGLQAGGVKGRAVVPHDPEASPLYQQLTRASRPYMPFGRAQLSDGEIDLVRRWILSGASLAAVPEAVPGDGPSAAELARLEERPITDEERAYWAFVKPVRRPAPEVSDPAWAENPIDAYLLAAMEAAGATPAPEADKVTLVRRAYLDVLGLPPTPEQIAAFVNDESPDAWEKLIDELLASPHYGERWARHWMDLVRYADSGGFEFDVDRPNMYRYRDYLIDAFNDDKPYDRFVKEQIAGDEYWPRVRRGHDRHGPAAGRPRSRGR